jgi:hypothetical protein
MTTKRIASGTGLVLVVSFWTMIAFVFDEQCVFEYLPRMVLGAVASATVLIFAWVWPKAAVGLAIFLAIWLAALSPIRGNHLKSFFIDSHSLREGMTVEEVRRVMSPYVEVGRKNVLSEDTPPGIFGATMLGVSENEAEHESRILFIPSEDFAADWCVVYPRDGVVTKVTIHPD